MRRAGEGWHDERHEVRLGAPTVSRRVSWTQVKGGSDDGDGGLETGGWGWGEVEDGEWVEEAWFKMYGGGGGISR